MIFRNTPKLYFLHCFVYSLQGCVADRVDQLAAATFRGPAAVGYTPAPADDTLDSDVD